MRGTLGCLLAVGVVATLHSNARAQGSDALRVERAAGAEDCPDALSLSQRVAAIRGRPEVATSTSYEVGFTHTADTFSATIRSGPNGESQRILEGRGLTCAALAQATAVTLALLFDSEVDSSPATEPEPPPVAPPPKLDNPLAPPIEIEQPSARPRVDNTFSLGAGGLGFALRPLSPAFTGELGLRIDGFRVGLGVLWNPPQAVALGPGRVNEFLLSGTARTCVALSRAESLQLDVCSGLFAGAVTAHAEGFTRNSRRVRSWLAIPFELSLADFSGHVGWELSAAALGSLVHHDFEVEGLGVAYQSPRFAGMLTLRAFGLVDW